MRYVNLAVIVAVCCLGLGFAYPTSHDPKNEGASIEEVMKTAMKGPLGKKVIAGEASDEEKRKYLDLMIDMSEAKPPQGDEKEWKAMTSEVVLNAAKVVVGREGAGEALKAATNCKACHDKFKPDSGK